MSAPVYPVVGMAGRPGLMKAGREQAPDFGTLKGSAQGRLAAVLTEIQKGPAVIGKEQRYRAQNEWIYAIVCAIATDMRPVRNRQLRMLEEQITEPFDALTRFVVERAKRGNQLEPLQSEFWL